MNQIVNQNQELWTAVLLTVYNRKEVTLYGLHTLYEAIEHLGKGYHFDIYMTDDGSTDGSTAAVKKKYPDIHVIRGNGKLYWSRGMNAAWNQAINSNQHYDYYIWFNDDSELKSDALLQLFHASRIKGDNSIISGAFCNHQGEVSYGGKNFRNELLIPTGGYQEIYLMNGNLVLIPQKVFKYIGYIKKIYRHGLGDYDYGLRARKIGLGVFLTSDYVGYADRHDDTIPKYHLSSNTFLTRWRILHDPKNSPIISFCFFYNHYGLFYAFRLLYRKYFYLFFPKTER